MGLKVRLISEKEKKNGAWWILEKIFETKIGIWIWFGLKFFDAWLAQVVKDGEVCGRFQVQVPMATKI